MFKHCNGHLMTGLLALSQLRRFMQNCTPDVRKGELRQVGVCFSHEDLD